MRRILIAAFVVLLAACSALTSFDGLVGGAASLDDGGADAGDAAAAGDGGSDGAPSIDQCPVITGSGVADGGEPTMVACDDGGLVADLTSSGKHCGSCSHDCGGAACANGLCTATAAVSESLPPWPLVVTPASPTTWSLQDGGAITVRGPGTQGMPQTLGSFVTGGAVYAQAQDDAGLVFLSDGLYATPDLATPLIKIVSGTGPIAFTQSATAVFFLTANSVNRIGRDGGQPSVLAGSQTPNGAIVLDATSVYWLNGAGTAMGSLMVADQAGGTVSTILPSLSRPGGVAVDERYVYFGEGNGPVALRRVPKRGGKVETLATWSGGNGEGPLFVLLDGAVLYLGVAGGQSNGQPGTVRVLRVPICGGAPLAVALTPSSTIGTPGPAFALWSSTFRVAGGVAYFAGPNQLMRQAW